MGRDDERNRMAVELDLECKYKTTNEIMYYK